LNWAESTDQAFSEMKLESLIRQLSDELGAKTMNFSSVSYQPYGASANLLIAQNISALAHLDASHISTHTYFDIGDVDRWSSFRLELEISTCGDIHPTVCLENLFHSLKPHFATLDSRSRGISTDANGLLRLMGETGLAAGLEIPNYKRRIAEGELCMFVAKGLTGEVNGAVRGLLTNVT